MSSTRPDADHRERTPKTILWEDWSRPLLDPKFPETSEEPELRQLLPLEPISLEDERRLGTRIDEHQRVLATKLGRPVSRAVATLDLMQSRGRLANPAMMDREQLEELRRKSLQDAVTGLLNRAAFDSLLARELGRATRHGHSLTLLLLDVDGFKRYNDHHGHVAGDAVLERIGAVIQLALRAGDWCARIGGDELAVLAPHADVEGGLHLADRIRERVEVALACSSVTVSIGAATRHNKCEPEQLRRAADDALYASKRRGGNAVTHASTLPAWRMV